MATGRLTIDLAAVVSNWAALDNMTPGATAAVVKANGYGLGAGKVAEALAKAGAQEFFVATAEEGAVLRKTLGAEPWIGVFSGHIQGDTELFQSYELTPMLNSVDQVLRHFESLPGHPFGVQLDTGMNRLGIEDEDWVALRDVVMGQQPDLLMSHLACADEPDHPMNARQLQTFRDMTDGIDVARSLAATGGILLGPEYHFDLVRPGIGLYGGLPYAEARDVAQLDLPVIQSRIVEPGESVGYGNAWVAEVPTRIATVSAGYADGILRSIGDGIALFAGDVPCPICGRISMDLITADVSMLGEVPDHLTILGSGNTVDVLAEAGGTIGYEILTSLGNRYARTYQE